MTGSSLTASVVSSLNRDSRTACADVVPFPMLSFRAFRLTSISFSLFSREDVDVKIGRRLSKFLQQRSVVVLLSLPLSDEDEAASVPQAGRPEAGPSFSLGSLLGGLSVPRYLAPWELPMTPVAAALALTPSARQPSLTPDEHTPLRPGRLLLPSRPSFSPDWRPSRASTSAAAIARKPAT